MCVYFDIYLSSPFTTNTRVYISPSFHRSISFDRLDWRWLRIFHNKIDARMSICLISAIEMIESIQNRVMPELAVRFRSFLSPFSEQIDHQFFSQVSPQKFINNISHILFDFLEPNTNAFLSSSTLLVTVRLELGLYGISFILYSLTKSFNQFLNPFLWFLTYVLFIEFMFSETEQRNQKSPSE